MIELLDALVLVLAVCVVVATVFWFARQATRLLPQKARDPDVDRRLNWGVIMVFALLFLFQSVSSVLAGAQDPWSLSHVADVLMVPVWMLAVLFVGGKVLNINLLVDIFKFPALVAVQAFLLVSLAFSCVAVFFGIRSQEIEVMSIEGLSGLGATAFLVIGILYLFRALATRRSARQS